MARIFDNIDQDLLGALRATMQVSKRSDFCVGYSDVFHCGRDLILDFPADVLLLSESEDLIAQTNELMQAYRDTAMRGAIPYKATGIVEYDEFCPRKLKDDIDKVD